jgi:hypothetical protein
MEDDCVSHGETSAEENEIVTHSADGPIKDFPKAQGQMWKAEKEPMEMGTMESRHAPFMPRRHGTSPFIMEKHEVSDRDHDRLEQDQPTHEPPFRLRLDILHAQPRC